MYFGVGELSLSASREQTVSRQENTGEDRYALNRNANGH